MKGVSPKRVYNYPVFRHTPYGYMFQRNTNRMQVKFYLSILRLIIRSKYAAIGQLDSK